MSVSMPWKRERRLLLEKKTQKRKKLGRLLDSQSEAKTLFKKRSRKKNSEERKPEELGKATLHP